VTIRNERNILLSAKITGIGKNAIVIAIDTPKIAGSYTLNVTVCKKGFLGLGCKAASITNVISVIKKPTMTIKYEITPSCIIYQPITFKAGEIHVVNEECNGDKYGGGNYSLPGDYKLTSAQFIETSQNGCRYEDPIRPISNNTAYLRWVCPEKGGIFCSGAGKWVHGYIMLYGQRQQIQVGQTLAGAYANPVEYGQTIEVIKLLGPSCQANGWTVAVTLIDGDGMENHIPAAGVADANGNITGSNGGGASFYWNGSTMTLSVSTPGLICPL
jgi:hypothetical protein